MALSADNPAGPAPVRAVVFDFDGVIVDSVGVKTEAFVALYAPHGEAVAEAVRAYHLAHGGMPRADKLRHWQSTLVDGPADDATIAALGARFGLMVREKVIACGEIAGAGAALAALAARLPLHVASATPETELVGIIAARGLTGRFRSIHGIPTTKAEALRMRVAEGLAPDEILMIGDATADHAAAAAVGTRFLGVVPEGAKSPFPDGTDTVPDLTGLAERVLGARTA
ncbi:HAD family hydrolase [Acuticoccus sediminis]|nr:HAD family hydrolase [Acuticoccus sediminis]